MTEQAEAVMLLTVSFGKSESELAKPLTPTEWGVFAGWLKEIGHAPDDLLKGDLSALLQDWEHPKVTVDRIQALLNRGATLGFALERWQRAGLWVLTRSDDEYPGRLKQLLGRKAPAVLFGCGNKKLLNASGIAVVGARHADDADIQFAESIGRQVAECGKLIVSGGAAGVDQEAMLGALHAEGTAVGVVSEDLLRCATSAKYRSHLISGDLALTSPFNPEARFHVGNAMARNKYVYCLAEKAVVVSSTRDKGGTWNGAVENLKRGWVPLWVKPTEDPGSGNPYLVEQGGQWLENLDDLAQTASSDGEPSNPPSEELYVKVRSLVTDLCAEPQRAGDVAAALGVTKPTADAWIKRMVEEGLLEKTPRPIQYVVPEKRLFA
ncbi:MAG: DNA-processing protein DprA [Gammaproteobacteria bacterium]|nr:DNA-processing protein DprA [Gammaproteobacteria bacterium]